MFICYVYMMKSVWLLARGTKESHPTLFYTAQAIDSTAVWAIQCECMVSALYMNRAARLYTAMSPEALQDCLKDIEQRNGRTPDDKQRGIVALDIDLLTYDGRILRPKDWDKHYVQQALEAL